MTIATIPKTRRKAVKIESPVTRVFATHQELLDDMDSFRRKISSTPGAAREFLINAGLLTKSGKSKQLIRD